MKRLLFLLMFVPVCLQAQVKNLQIQGASPNLYLNHTVAPKENYYSIGRMYNISPKEIAPFNDLQLEKGLSLNQVVKIPLKEVNFLQAGIPASNEALIPVYHKVSDKESLFHISSNYNKVAIETLKRWNNIKSESVGTGTEIVVGYLKVRKDLSALATPGLPPVVPGQIPGAPVTTAATQEVKVVKEEPKKEQPVVNTPVAKKPVKENKPVEPEIKNTPIIEQPETKTSSGIGSNNKGFEGGAFKNEYVKQTVNKSLLKESGAGGIFKSPSGWQDGKYYCLYNNALAGSIVKITNNNTGKSVYAKVLDVVPDINSNNGLIIRISNAAASELESGDNKFDCTITYNK